MADRHHPFFHDFKDGHINDEIVESNAANVPIVIKRWERCECGTVRTHYLNLIMWERVGGYAYPERPKEIDRATREEWTAREFYATTDLPAAVVRQIRRLAK